MYVAQSKEGIKGLVVPRVKFQPTRFSANTLYAPLDSKSLYFRGRTATVVFIFLKPATGSG